jgi:hypothetical protein
LFAQTDLNDSLLLLDGIIHEAAASSTVFSEYIYLLTLEISR